MAGTTYFIVVDGWGGDDYVVYRADDRVCVAASVVGDELTLTSVEYGSDVEISVIVLPLVTPSLILMGHDPIWLGVLLAINLQTSFLTPPFGFSLATASRRMVNSAWISNCCCSRSSRACPPRNQSSIRAR